MTKLEKMLYVLALGVIIALGGLYVGLRATLSDKPDAIHITEDYLTGPFDGEDWSHGWQGEERALQLQPALKNGLEIDYGYSMMSSEYQLQQPL